MFSGFPAGAYRKFSAKLEGAKGRTCFDRLQNYFDTVSGKEKKKVPWDVSTRMDSGKFFYYPHEAPRSSGDLTCFENSAHLLMAAQELYPRSTPQLAYIDEGKRGVHSVVMLKHDGKLFGGDFSYNFLSPIHFSGKDIVYDKGKIKFKSFQVVPDSRVSHLISSLRGEGGLESYLSAGGQMMEKDPTAFRPYSIFAKYNDGKLVSELRFVDFDLNNNIALRRIYDLGKNEFDVELSRFSYSDWSRLAREVKFAWSKNSTRMGQPIYIDGRMPIKELQKLKVADFIKQWGAYHHALKFKARRDHRSLPNSFFYVQRDRSDALGRCTSKKLTDYFARVDPTFVQHVLDYNMLRDAPTIIEAVSGKEGAKSWREVTAPHKPGYFISMVVSALQDVARKEMRKQRHWDWKAIRSLRQ
jgi:hypothetical protein